jgi:hypothetical protein
MQIEQPEPTERHNLGPRPTPAEHEYFQPEFLIHHYLTEKYDLINWVYEDVLLFEPRKFNWSYPRSQQVSAGRSIDRNGDGYFRENHEHRIACSYAKKSLHCEEPSDPPNRVLTHTQSVQLGPSILQKVSMCVYFYRQ